jgi:cobalt-zinc-cadmium efflux system outer membrane protein
MWSFRARGYAALCVLLLPILLVGTAVRAGAQALTISETLHLARQHNAALQAEQQTLAVAEGELLSARTFRHNPRLEVEGAAGTERNKERDTTRDVGVKMTQEFELGGQRRWRTQVAAAALERTKWDVRDAERALVQEVQDTFYRLVFLEEKRAFADQAVELAQQLVRITEERFRAGDSPQIDVNLARVELQNVLRQRLEVLSHLTQARLTLNRLLGRPVDAPLAVRGTLDTPPPPLAVGPLRQQAQQQRPDLQSRSAAAQVAAGEVGLAKAERAPNLEVGVVFARQETGDTVEQSFGGSLALSLPLWNRNRGEILAAQARSRRATLQRAALQQEIDTEVATAIAAVEQLRATLQLFTETILPQSRDNLTLLQQAFTAGEMDIVALVTAQRTFLTTNQEYLDTLLAYRAALTALESHVGAPVTAQQ